MWEDDGSNMVKTAPESPMEFTIDGKPGGSPVNALFARGLTPGQYFEIDISTTFTLGNKGGTQAATILIESDGCFLVCELC
mmetsp:Transcript_9731/g.13673  ORF Transcript_9731/g.13673 Transcript_9731/m.13673 type:complete len:81 (-) Transcript_9731:115-357(-)